MFQIIKVGGTRKLEDEQTQKENEELMNLVEEEDQITHILNLDDAVDPQNILGEFNLNILFHFVTCWVHNNKFFSYCRCLQGGS